MVGVKPIVPGTPRLKRGVPFLWGRRGEGEVVRIEGEVAKDRRGGGESRRRGGEDRAPVILGGHRTGRSDLQGSGGTFADPPSLLLALSYIL